MTGRRKSIWRWIVVTVCAVCVFSLLASTSQAQPVEQGWKGIRPLITNRETVETVLGKRVWVDGNAYYAYDTDDAFIQVNYSTAPCAENRYGRGKYNVPVGTVLGYTVNLKKIVKLADIRFDRPKYFKDTGGDVHNSWYYVNMDAGTSIGAFAQDAEGDEYVGQIRYEAGKEVAHQFRCKGSVKNR